MDRAPTITELIQQRVSCRAYENRPVPKAYLDQILEAARWAPSACNQQPWRFAVVQDQALRHRLVNESFRVGIPMKWALNAGALMVVGMQRSFKVHRVASTMTGIDYPLLDLGIAGEHLVLQAEALGLGTCWIGWIRPRIVRRLVGWPRTIKPVSIISVGWPADGERSSRLRRPIEETVTWF